MHSVLPDFVGIGALKAGTTYLDIMLRTHPDLSLPLHLKEVDFFSRHHDRGLEWYANQFAAPDGRRRGEFSPRYLNDPQCAGRIHAANPAARLVLSVRHPVARAHSQYRHWVQETGYGNQFADFLREHPGAIDRSKYWHDLQPYRAVFPDEQIHVVVFEEMTVRPLPILQNVFGYLGVDDRHVPADLDAAVNVSGTPRFPRLYVQSKKVSRWLYDRGAGTAVERVKATGIGRTLRGSDRSRRAPTSAVLRPPADSVATEVLAALRDDATALSDWLGRDLVTLWEL